MKELSNDDMWILLTKLSLLLDGYNPSNNREVNAKRLLKKLLTKLKNKYGNDKP